jgi:hypothetical protein
MNSPLVLLVPLILILALPTYFVLRNRRGAKAGMNELLSQGFNVDSLFDMHDMFVALDNINKRIAFVNVELQTFPSNRQSEMRHFTIIEPYSKLENIVVQYSNSLILIDVYFNSPNTFNSTTKMSFSQAPQSRAQIRDLVAAWPGTKSAGRRPSDA